MVRACDVLKPFRHDGETVGLADLVERTQLCKTTVFRLLQSLSRGGLVERVGKGVYSSRIRPLLARSFRLGFAAQTDSEFSREVTASLQRTALRGQIHLITTATALGKPCATRSADPRARRPRAGISDLRARAPIIASKFLEANIPVIAIEIPHPGAPYFGANNYQAGLIGGKALGRWARQTWDGQADQVVLLELPIAGPSLPQLRINGIMEGLRKELPSIAVTPVRRLDGRGDFDHILEVVRRFLRRSPLKRTLIGAVNDTCALVALRAFASQSPGETYCRCRVRHPRRRHFSSR